MKRIVQFVSRDYAIREMSPPRKVDMDSLAVLVILPEDNCFNLQD